MKVVWTLVGFVAISASGSALPNPAPAIEQVKACGFADAVIKNDPTLQETVVVVLGATTALDEQLRCVAKASLNTDTYVYFPESLNGKYENVYRALSQEKALAEARAWLDRPGLLARLPKYEEGKTDDLEFAKSLEHLCGKAASGAFGLSDGRLTMSLTWMKTAARRKQGSDAFYCLMHSATVAGFPLGFEGNEAFTTRETGL